MEQIREKQNLLVFKQETSVKNNGTLGYFLSKKKFKVACLSSFAYLTSDRISSLLSKCYHSDSKVLMRVYESLLNQKQ